MREKPSDDGRGDGAGGTHELRPDVVPEADDLEAADPEAVILCRRCGHLIARPKDKTQVGGRFRHTFANPTGRVFEIGCFTVADGCGPSGEKTDEFTWFRGYLWRLALCRACYVHLGWQFTSASGSGGFWGLILNRLAFPI